jgi:peptidyl-prolyl cis-trans isomerase C
VPSNDLEPNMAIPLKILGTLRSAGPIQGRSLRRWPVALLAGCLLAGCVGTSEQKSETPTVEAPKYVLEVGDRKVTLEQLNQIFTARMGEFADHTELNHLKSQVLDDLVNEYLLDLEAQKAGVTATEEELQMYLRGMESEKTKEGEDSKPGADLQQEIRSTIRVQRYIRDVLMKGYEPDPAKVQAYFIEHPDEFQVAESVRVKEILVRTADQAEKVMELLKAGQYRNFSQLAKQYSIAPSNISGGDMGFFARGDLPEEMEKVFFNMNVPGRVSPIIQTKYGYHIFMLVERRREHREPFSEAKERIVNRMSEEHQKQVLAEKIQQLRASIPVVLYRRNLDFSYNGQEFQGGSDK